MARPGVTYHEVAEAATKLTEQNTRPSIEAVRGVLGTGSNSTINRYLKQWRDHQGPQAELEKGLPVSLLTAVKGIYEAISDEAKTLYLEAEAGHKQVVVELKSQMETLESTKNQLNQEKITQAETLTQVGEENAALKRQLDELQKVQSESTNENQLLNARLDDKVSELERLAQQLNHAQANLEHYRDTVREERVTEKRELNEKIAGLENKLQAQQTLATNLNSEFIKLQQQHAAAEKAKNTAITERENGVLQYKNCEAELQQSKSEINQLQAMHSQLMTTHEALQNESNTHRAKLTESTIQYEKYKTQAKLLEATLSKTEDKLKTLGDKVLFLTQEKTELSFQLKQALSVS